MSFDAASRDGDIGYVGDAAAAIDVLSDQLCTSSLSCRPGLLSFGSFGAKIAGRGGGPDPPQIVIPFASPGSRNAKYSAAD